MEKLICEQCQKRGLKSTISSPMYGTTTLMAYTPGYYDENGEYHSNKNPNITTYEYTCSNGHRFIKTN